MEAQIIVDKDLLADWLEERKVAFKDQDVWEYACFMAAYGDKDVFIEDFKEGETINS